MPARMVHWDRDVEDPVLVNSGRTHKRRALELRVFIELEERNDLLQFEIERFDFAPLDSKAATLREALLE